MIEILSKSTSKEKVKKFLMDMFIKKIKYIIRSYSTEKRKLLKNILYFENVPFGDFSSIKEVYEIVNKIGARNICFDISHYYCYLKKYKKLNNKDAIKFLIKMLNSLDFKKYGIYFHILDSRGLDKKGYEHLNFGDGDLFLSKSNINKIFNSISYGILEVPCKWKENVDWMIKNIKIKFDRILMPLPKDAEIFLPEALMFAKSNTIMHIYLFKHEDEVEKTKKDLINNIKSLGFDALVKDVVRCGDYGPKIHRYCFDIIINK